MSKRKNSIENMRYKIPGVCNRFWQVHGTFIFLCALTALLAVLISFSYVFMRGIRKLEPKYSFVFFCEVDDYSAALEYSKRYEKMAQVYFVVYDERFAAEPSEEGESSSQYDFSYFGDNISDNPLPESFLTILRPNLTIFDAYKFADFGYDNGYKLTATEADRIVQEVLARI